MQECSKRWHGAATRDPSGRRAESLGQASYMMMADERFFEMRSRFAPLFSMNRTGHGLFAAKGAQTDSNNEWRQSRRLMTTTTFGGLGSMCLNPPFSVEISNQFLASRSQTKCWPQQLVP